MTIILIIIILIIFSLHCSTRHQQCRRQAWLPLACPRQPSPPPLPNPPLRYFCCCFLYFPLFFFVFLYRSFLCFLLLQQVAAPQSKKFRPPQKSQRYIPKPIPLELGNLKTYSKCICICFCTCIAQDDFSNKVNPIS